MAEQNWTTKPQTPRGGGEAIRRGAYSGGEAIRRGAYSGRKASDRGEAKKMGGGGEAGEGGGN